MAKVLSAADLFEAGGIAGGQHQFGPGAVHLFCQRQPKPFGGADQPVAFACDAHAATGIGRMVAISSATLMPNLRN